MKCKCPQCTDDPAYTYTPEFMRECLARWLIAKLREIPKRKDRAAFMRRMVGGKANEDEIRRMVFDLWKAGSSQ